MTKDEESQLTRIENRLIDMHGRVAVIERHVEDTKPIIEDYKATKNKSLGFIAGVSSVAGVVGSALTYLGVKIGLNH